MRKCLPYLLLFVSFAGLSQSSLPKPLEDSLWNIWYDESVAPEKRLRAISDIAWDGYLYSKPDSAFYFSQLEYEFAKDKGMQKEMASALNTQGVSFYVRGEYVKAIEYYKKALDIREKLGDKPGMGASIGNIGNIFQIQGNYAQAIEYYTKGLKIQEEIDDQLGMAITMINISTIYQNIEEYETAKEYLNKSLLLYEALKDKIGVGYVYTNLGICYSHLNDADMAIEYYTKSLTIHSEEGNLNGMAYCYNNIGLIYYENGELVKAIDYFSKGLNIREEIGDAKGKAVMLNNLGKAYRMQGQLNKAIALYTESLKISNELGSVLQIKEVSYELWLTYKETGRYKDALTMHELYIVMRDSLESEDNQKEIFKQEFKYSYEKQTALDSIANAKKIEIKNAELSKKEIEIKAKRNQQYALFGGLILVILFAGVMYNRFKVTQKQKSIIEEKEKETALQKELIEIKQKETERQKEVVEKQKEHIEEVHKEITDSINYAERIQRSFLASREMLDANLGVTSSVRPLAEVSRREPGYFVFFKPKDVVSGDFYWASILKNGNFAFCCADSTGHGVPGAIMSILNVSSLEKSVEKETEPHKILNKTRELIINRLKKDGSPEGGKDGMDCSLLVLNHDKTQLSFASANNPVFIVRAVTSSGSPEAAVSRSETHELLEFRPDKMPVGKHDKDQEPFTLQTVSLQKGDVIYTLTDGFPDQFGGEKGKKYMIKNLKELFLSLAHLPMKEQHTKLEEEFKNWKGSNEQIDDVCIIGVRI